MLEKIVFMHSKSLKSMYLAVSNFVRLFVLDLPILAQFSISILLKNVKIPMVFRHFYEVQKWNTGSDFFT